MKHYVRGASKNTWNIRYSTRTPTELRAEDLLTSEGI